MSSFEKDKPLSELVPVEPDNLMLGRKIQSAVTNISLMSSLAGSDTIQQVIKRVGKTFFVDALVLREKQGIPVATSLSSAGGIIAWVCKSKMAKKAINMLDAGLDQGVVTPEMAIELIENPDLLKELLDSFVQPK